MNKLTYFYRQNNFKCLVYNKLFIQLQRNSIVLGFPFRMETFVKLASLRIGKF
jgi:hypothetical protein